MSDLDFELDIHKYSPTELEGLFSLKFPYEREQLRDNIALMKEKIVQDGKLEKKKQKAVIMFLDKSENRLNKLLLDRKNRMKQNVTTQYGSNFLIDRNSQREKNPDGRPPILTINPYRAGLGSDVSMLTGWDSGTTTQLLSIDSRFRSRYFKTTSTDFLIDLPLSLKNVVKLELVSLEMPATYFGISKRLGNNYFHIYDQRLSGCETDPPCSPSVYKIEIPDGNYTRKEMQAALNLELKVFGAWANNYAATHCFGESVYTTPQASIDAKSGRTIIDLGDIRRYMFFNMKSTVAEDGPVPTLVLAGSTICGNSPGQVFFSDFPIQMKLGWLLGYRKAGYKNSNYEASSFQLCTPWDMGTYISEGIFDGWGSKYFYFVLNDFQKNSVNGVDAVLNSAVVPSGNILARLTRSAASSAFHFGFQLDTGSVSDDDSTRRRVYFGPVDLRKFHIQILDEYGRVIDLNNMDISFALKLTRLYD